MITEFITDEINKERKLLNFHIYNLPFDIKKGEIIWLKSFADLLKMGDFVFPESPAFMPTINDLLNMDCDGFRVVEILYDYNKNQFIRTVKLEEEF